MKRQIIEIESFDDFLNKFKSFLFCRDSIQPEFCLEVSHQYFYKFINGYTEKQLNADILNNKEMFKWKQTNAFYYPNTNMFSMSNEQRGIKGYEVTKN